MGYTLEVCRKCGQIETEANLTRDGDGDCFHPKCKMEKMKTKPYDEIVLSCGKYYGQYISSRVMTNWCGFWEDIDKYSESNKIGIVDKDLEKKLDQFF